MGKPLGVDILEQKITIPLLGALGNVSAQKAQQVRDMVKEIVGKPQIKDDIVKFVKENGGLEYAITRLNDYVEEAVRVLDVLPDSTEKSFLIELAHYTAIREK